MKSAPVVQGGCETIENARYFIKMAPLDLGAEWAHLIKKIHIKGQLLGLNPDN